MRERQQRFADAMKREKGTLANNVLDLEDRVRELEFEMERVGLALINKAKRG